MATSRRKTGQGKAPSASSADPATQYALDVAAGRIVAGPHVRDACARHLRDLEEGPARGLTWDPAAAQRFADFCREVCRLAGGQFEGEPFELQPAQAFIAGSLFGWKRADGTRRFRVAFVEMGKGNGKSPLAAAIGLYGLVADGEPRAEIYAAATKRDQAQVLFRDAVAMVDQSPELRARVVKSGKNPVWNLAYLRAASFFRPIASDNAQSGPRPHMGLLDEVHEHKSPLMVEMIRAGFKWRRQPLLLMITNSGNDRTSVCWEQHEYARQVGAGLLEDDAYFGYVCALDDGDDPLTDESCWAKANPLLGQTVTVQYLREQVTEARGMPGKESTVRRLNFCQWTEALSPWIGAQPWMAARDADFDEERLVGRRCWGGLDLSSTTDLTAFSLLFEPTADDPHWRLKCWFWLPSDQLEDKSRRDKVDYAAWRAGGWLETTTGKAVDKRFVLARVVACCARYDVADIGFDRWRIEDFRALAIDEGVDYLPLEPFGQGFQSMGPACDEFERMLLAGDLKHDGNPILTWNAACTVVDEDPAGNRKPTKKRSTGRIDGIVASVMAAGRAAGGDKTVTLDGSEVWSA